MCQKTDQMGISKIFAYNFSKNYPIAIYSICLQSYNWGLSNKPKYIMYYGLGIEILLKQCKSTKHLISFLRHCKPPLTKIDMLIMPSCISNIHITEAPTNLCAWLPRYIRPHHIRSKHDQKTLKASSSPFTTTSSSSTFIPLQLQFWTQKT